MLVSGCIDGTFVRVVNDHSPGDSNIRRSSPRHGHGIINVEFSDLGQTSGGQGSAVGNFQGSQVIFRIFVDDVHHVFLINVSLLQAQNLIQIFIMAQSQGGRTFVDATICFVLDETGFASTKRLIGSSDGANLMLACKMRGWAEGCGERPRMLSIASGGTKSQRRKIGTYLCRGGIHCRHLRRDGYSRNSIHS